MYFNFLLIILVFIVYLITHFNNNIKKETKDNLFLSVIMIILFVLVATRSLTTGNDTQMYLNVFKNCSALKWDAVIFGGYFEGGYLIFNVLISYISSSPRFFMFVMSFVFNLVIYKFIKDNSNNYFLSVLMYICMLFFYTSMTMMRQFLAMMVILSSLKYVKEKKLPLFILSVILASLFHTSALTCFIIYPIYHIKYTHKKAFIICVVSVFCLLLLQPIVTFLMNLVGRTNYYESQFGSNKLANTLSFTINIVLFLFALMSKNKNIKNYDFYLYILLISAAVNFISTDMNIISRAADYFDIFAIICIPNIVYSLKNKNTKMICSLILLIFLALYSGIIMKYRPNWNTAYNYKSCLIFTENSVCE